MQQRKLKVLSAVRAFVHVFTFFANPASEDAARVVALLSMHVTCSAFFSSEE
jgi:hypothetical protein